ncbi:MAG: carbohydrate ABC transporter permease [Treponema sp.]|jgi:multiple sugar transport system permease protein|nr:carbohydrate ABC transporter permease [Treponema sp.]
MIGRKWFIPKRVILYTILVILSVACVIPLYWLVRSSFMRSTDIYRVDPIIFWPKEMIWDNYTQAIRFMVFIRKTINTLVILIGNMVGAVVTSCMAAYAFSRVQWKGRQICFFILLTSMMLPGTVTIIPQYLIWAKLGFVDTYVPLILPAFFGGGAFNIFLLRQFFLGIPRDLDEAAKIDGAGNLWIFSRIIVPLAKPAVMVICLFIFLGCWNDFFGPLIYLNSADKYTLALGLLQFRGNYSTRWNWLMAASTIVVIPCIVMYVFTQRRLIEGIALTGLKS